MGGANNYNWFGSFSFSKGNSQLTIRLSIFVKKQATMERRHVIAAPPCVSWDGMGTVIHPHWDWDKIGLFQSSSLSNWLLLPSIMRNCRQCLVCRKAARWYCCQCAHCHPGALSGMEPASVSLFVKWDIAIPVSGLECENLMIQTRWSAS